MKLVLVEDHEIMLQGLVRLLAEAGHEVAATAASGGEALETLRRTPCDLLLLDLSLPDGTGPWLIGEIHRNHPDLRILVLTMHADENLALQALRAGATGYMVKGGRMQQLLHAVQAVAEGSTYVHSEVAGPVMQRLRDSCYGTPSLSDRERAILDLATRGCSNREMAEQLNFSLGTIKLTMSRLLTRFGVKDRSRLILKAVDLGLVRPPR